VVRLLPLLLTRSSRLFSPAIYPYFRYNKYIRTSHGQRSYNYMDIQAGPYSTSDWLSHEETDVDVSVKAV
jgi:hypothetical protein